MDKIKSIQALQILDSRGNPTIRVIMTSSEGIRSSASVPSGASTGEHEALELRDKDPGQYLGKSVQKAVENVNGPLQEHLIGQSCFDQEKIDQIMIDLDGTKNKEKLGANAILGVSLANARLASQIKNIPLYCHLGGKSAITLPCPMMNIINGGAHADNFLDLQEFMIRPVSAPTFREALRWGVEIFHSLKGLLSEKGFSTSVGDEGGFAPLLKSNEEALGFIMLAIEKAGYKPGSQIRIALDPAASEFFEEGKYIEKKKKQQNEDFKERSSEEMIEYYSDLCKNYPIDSIEDGLDQNDWQGWKLFTDKLGNDLQIVGDDLFVTNLKFLEKGIEAQTANSILIKVNQIGTLTETLQTIATAQKNQYTTVISHRSGETEDSFIADLAVAVNAGQIKTGALSRSDRVAKYNRLLEIELELGPKASYKDSNRWKGFHL